MVFMYEHFNENRTFHFFHEPGRVASSQQKFKYIIETYTTLLVVNTQITLIYLYIIVDAHTN